MVEADSSKLETLIFDSTALVSVQAAALSGEVGAGAGAREMPARLVVRLDCTTRVRVKIEE